MQNRLLAALPPDESARLTPHLTLVPMTQGMVIDDAEDCLYFPVDCVIALLYELSDGASAEISLVGNEGVAGIGLSIGGIPTLNRAVVQTAGQALKVHATSLHDEFSRDDKLQQLLLAYTRALFAQMAQTAACNLSHPVHQRLCRWILLTLDRIVSDRLVMGRELVASILGVPTEDVDDAVAKLARLGAVSGSRSQITVLNRPQLERLCCECYALVKQESERLLQPVARHKLRSII